MRKDFSVADDYNAYLVQIHTIDCAFKDATMYCGSLFQPYYEKI